MDNRFQVLKRYNPYAIRKIYPGIRHEVIHEQAFYMFEWLMTVSQKDRSTHLIKEDYFKPYSDSANALTSEKFAESIQYAYDSISKNKMLLAYPESKVDVSLVYEGDEFDVSKESGSVVYHHNIKNPLSQDGSNIIGGYCVIQNKRGDFLTLLSKEDIEKHRKVAKTDYIWREWFKEMALKTVIKKAVKQHFADIYENIEQIDNENYNLENPLDLDLKYKQEIDAIETLEELKAYYDVNKGKGEDFDKYITIRKAELSK
jgi:hypothetical protein